MSVSATKPHLSNTRFSGASRFHAIHATTKSVSHTMNLGVPKNRAIDSAHSPSLSGLERGRRHGNWRRSPLGLSNPRSATIAARRVVLVKVFAPVARQQVVQHVVDGDRPAQVVIRINHGQREDVIRGHAARNV